MLTQQIQKSARAISPLMDCNKMTARWFAASAKLLMSWGTVCILAGAAVAGDTRIASPIRGVVRAVQQATISTDAPLRVIGLPFRESDRFKRGDTLAVFDCRRQKADLDAATAVLREASLTVESNQQLDRHQAVGKNELEISRARADKTKADVAGLESRLDECKLVAPFSGRIAELSIRVHERTTPQRAFISIIDDSQLEIELIAPASLLPELKIGVGFAFRIDELGGHDVPAEVHKLSASVDPVSKTIKIIGLIKTQDSGILAGMSGTATFNTETKP